MSDDISISIVGAKTAYAVPREIGVYVAKLEAQLQTRDDQLKDFKEGLKRLRARGQALSAENKTLEKKLEVLTKCECQMDTVAYNNSKANEKAREYFAKWGK